MHTEAIPGRNAMFRNNIEGAHEGWWYGLRF